MTEKVFVVTDLFFGVAKKFRFIQILCIPKNCRKKWMILLNFKTQPTFTRLTKYFINLGGPQDVSKTENWLIHIFKLVFKGFNKLVLTLAYVLIIIYVHIIKNYLNFAPSILIARGFFRRLTLPITPTSWDNDI